MISVAMAYYNGGEYIREQVESILPQLGPEDELIISVDAAEDGSLDLLKEMSREDDRIRLVRGPGKGVVRNFDHAISRCAGDFIFLTDQDDVWVDGKVEKVMACFEDSEVKVVLHNAMITDELGAETGETMFALRKSRPGILKNLVKNCYVGCCMAFRAELLSLIRPIPKEMYMHDYWIGTAAELSGKVALIEEPLLLYRRHSSNVTDLHHGSLSFMVKKRVDMVRCLRLLKERMK